MTLAQAPRALQAAVGAMLGPRSTLAPSQQAELTPSDGAVFSDWVAISGTTALVAGATNSTTAAVYVFVASGGTWSQQAVLTASDGVAGDLFGRSVAISGSTAVIGAPGKNSYAGAAYVFVNSGGVWSQQAELTASDGVAGDSFGSVAISGSTVVVGAAGKNSLTGAAYVFVRSGSLWAQQTELTASDGVANDRFGVSVGISGATVVVGAYGKNRSTGAAYVLVHSGGTWSQQAELTPSDGTYNILFGGSVAISGSTVVVGADDKGSALQGAAYIFTASGGIWSQQAELIASDGRRFDHFGSSVAISGSAAVVGAGNKNSATGAVYVFVGSGGIWSQQAELTASDGAAGDYFGISVALYRSKAVIAAPGHGTIGAAYVFVNV